MTKFADFVTEHKLNIRRIPSASAALEKLRPEDRAIRLAHRNRGEKKVEGEKKERRSGRPITNRALQAALTGKALSGPQKNRLLSAVNKILEQKKQPVVDLKALF